MNRLWTASALAILVLWGTAAPALAVPPTVTPSPGYEARLQEQRKAMSSPTVVQPAMPFAPAPRHHTRRKH